MDDGRNLREGHGTESLYCLGAVWGWNTAYTLLLYILPWQVRSGFYLGRVLLDYYKVCF